MLIPCVFQYIMAIILLSFAHRMMVRNEVSSTLSANSDLGVQGLSPAGVGHRSHLCSLEP